MDPSDITYILALMRREHLLNEFLVIEQQFSATTSRLMSLQVSMKALAKDLQIHNLDLCNSAFSEALASLFRGKGSIEELRELFSAAKTQSVATMSGSSTTKSSARLANAKDSTSTPEE